LSFSCLFVMAFPAFVHPIQFLSACLSCPLLPKFLNFFSVSSDICFPPRFLPFLFPPSLTVFSHSDRLFCHVLCVRSSEHPICSAPSVVRFVWAPLTHSRSFPFHTTHAFNDEYRGSCRDLPPLFLVSHCVRRPRLTSFRCGESNQEADSLSIFFFFFLTAMPSPLPLPLWAV